MQRDAVQPVIQILSELSFLNHLVHIAVRGADHVQVDRNRLIASERDHFAFFDDPQQSGLQHERHVADLVQKQRAAVGLKNLADASFFRRPVNAPRV